MTVMYGQAKVKKTMTPAEFANKMSDIKANCQPAERHIQADILMSELLVQLGYSEGINKFRNMAKWYSGGNSKTINIDNKNQLWDCDGKGSIVLRRRV